jgi:rod shape-determining protein MreC
MFPERGTKNKRKSLFLLAFILIFSFTLMTVSAKNDKMPLFPEFLALAVLEPVQTKTTDALKFVSDGIDHYFNLVNVSNENEILKKEIASLHNENNQLIEEIKSLVRLEGLQNFSKGKEYSVLPAKVIGRDATQWSKMIFLDKGTNDGVKESFAVVSPLGVVGQIVQAGPNSSKVLLITDSRSAVDAMFQESRTRGVVVGNGSLNCDMKFVALTEEVNEGDVAISSGLGGIYPKGLVVGRVVSAVKKQQSLFQTLSVVPGADLSRLEEALIVLPKT